MYLINRTLILPMNTKNRSSKSQCQHEKFLWEQGGEERVWYSPPFISGKLKNLLLLGWSWKQKHNETRADKADIYTLSFFLLVTIQEYDYLISIKLGMWM